MADLPGVGNGSTVGVIIKTTADDGAIKQTQAELTVLSDTAKGAGASAASSFDKFNSSLKSVGQNVTEVGRSMTTNFTLPIAGAAYESGKLAMQFQQDMELLATNAGVPQSAIKGLSDQILAMAPQVGQGPDALAQAFFHIATAGQGIWNTAQQLNVLKVASQGAAIGQANLDDTTYALTSTLAANVQGATDAQAAMGLLLGTVQAGDMHLSDLNEVIGTGLMGTLSTFGVSLQSAGAALADFGDLGEKGAAAGTRLRMMLTLMTSPSQAASKILSDLGLTTDETSTSVDTMNQVFAKTGLTTTKLADDLRQPNGIFVAITDLKDSLEKAGLNASQTDAILSKAFGGGRTDAALLQLLDTTDRLDLKYRQIGNDTKDFSDNWAKQQQTAKQQWDQAWSGIQASMTKLGIAILPQVTSAMKDVSGAISGAAGWFSQMDQSQQTVFLHIAAGLAATGPVMMGLGSMIKMTGNVNSLIKTLGGSWLDTSQLIGAGAVMGPIATAGAMADIALVYAAVESVIGAINTMNQVKASIAKDVTSMQNAISAIQSAQKAGKISKAQADKDIASIQSDINSAQGAQNQSFGSAVGNQLYSEFLSKIKADFGFASGSNYAPGGWSMVGENGPEAVYLPQGSMVKTSAQTAGMRSSAGGGITLNQTNNNYSQFDMTEANRILAWQLSNAI